MLTIRTARARGLPTVLALAVGPTGPHTAEGVPAALADEARALLADRADAGAAGALAQLPRPTARPRRLLLAGVGAGDEAGWRAAGAALARADAAPFTVAVPAEAPATAVRGLVEGLRLGSYTFTAGARPPRPGTVTLALADEARHATARAVADTTAEATAWARDLTNTPSSRKNPAWFAAQVQRAAAGRADLDVRVLGPRDLVEGGFGGVLAVGGGSASAPCLVELRYRPRGARTHVALVGKGITFDTGGLSIKPADAMKLMRKDMGGAAAVVAATAGAAALRLPVRITAVVPLAENMVSGSAYRPGDVVTHYDGRTSEITNTDAEGRLVLADALGYTVRRIRPDLLVDLATLTGANAVALGKRHAALYSDNDDLAGALADAAAAAGERAWRMPLPADYTEYLRGDIADLHPAPERGAGSVVAALFLREFTGALRDRWAHLDMSAPSWADRADGELAKGATGWGVRMLLRWLATL